MGAWEETGTTRAGGCPSAEATCQILTPTGLWAEHQHGLFVQRLLYQLCPRFRCCGAAAVIPSGRLCFPSCGVNLPPLTAGGLMLSVRLPYFKADSKLQHGLGKGPGVQMAQHHVLAATELARGSMIVLNSVTVALRTGWTCPWWVCWAEQGPAGRSSREEISASLGNSSQWPELYVSGRTSLAPLGEFKHCLGSLCMECCGGGCVWWVGC